MVAVGGWDSFFLGRVAMYHCTHQSISLQNLVVGVGRVGLD